MDKEIASFNHSINVTERKNIVISGVKKIDNFQAVFSGVNSGNCGLFIDTLNIAYDTSQYLSTSLSVQSQIS